MSVHWGVTVAGTSYGPTADVPAPFIVSRGADYVFRRWPGQQVMLVADAREHLAALLSRDGRQLLHGVWSDSAWLACAHHNGLACEVRLLALPAGADDPLAKLSLIRSAPAGFHALVGPEPYETQSPSEGNVA